MLEDERRLERERSIFRATRGPDYNRLKQSIRVEKADLDTRAASANRLHSIARIAYVTAVQERRIEPYPRGFRPAPGYRSQGRDDSFER